MRSFTFWLFFMCNFFIHAQTVNFFIPKTTLIRPPILPHPNLVIPKPNFPTPLLVPIPSTPLEECIPNNKTIEPSNHCEEIPIFKAEKGKKGGGKNAKHANEKTRKVAEEKYSKAKQAYEKLKATPNKTPELKKQLLKKKKEMEYFRKKKDFTGENHSQNAKK